MAHILPEGILSDVLLDWLGAKYLGKLDSALCRKSTRPALLNYFAALRYFALPEVYPSSQFCLVEWAIARRIGCTSALIKDDVGLSWDQLRDALYRLFTYCGYRIKNITIKDWEFGTIWITKLIESMCYNLEIFSVMNCRLTTALPQMIANKATRIRELYLKSTNSNQALPELYFADITCSTVERFGLVAELQAGCLVHIGRAFPNMQHLYLQVTIASFDDRQCWLDFIAATNPGLCSAFVRFCPSVTAELVTTMVDTWRNCKEFGMLFHLWFSLQSLNSFCARSAGSLQVLTLGYEYCVRFGTTMVASLLQSNALRALHLYNIELSKGELSYILKSSRNLRELNMHVLSHLPEVYSAIAEHGGALQSVNVTPYTVHPGRSYAAHVTVLVRQCTKLRVLKIAHDHQAAREARPGLRVMMCDANVATWPLPE